jgi:hypothetical protein
LLKRPIIIIKKFFSGAVISKQAVPSASSKIKGIGHFAAAHMAMIGQLIIMTPILIGTACMTQD